MLHSGEDDWGVSDKFRQDVERALGKPGMGTIAALAEVKAMRARLEYIRDHAVGSTWDMAYVKYLAEDVLK